MRALALVLAVVSLSLPAHGRDVQPWALSGRVLSEGSGEAIAGKEVLLRRLHHPWWCIFCLGGYRDIASTVTDQSGRFQFSDSKKGSYEVATRCPPTSTFEFAARVSVGELKVGSYKVDIEHGINHCKFKR
jgi:hypothetical protein